MERCVCDREISCTVASSGQKYGEILIILVDNMAENYDPDAVNLQIRTKVTQCNVELKQQLRISL